MLLEEAEELFKSYFPFYLLIVLPMFIIISPINPVSAACEFPIYRMQHYDLHGVAHGCRSATVNLEARSLHTWSTSRHCVIAKIQDLTIDHYHNIRSKAGALLIVIPKDLSSLSGDEKQHLVTLEDAMLTQEVSIPVYFITASRELDKILAEISNNISEEDKTKTALEALFHSVAANGYQIVINPKSPNAITDIKVATLQGNLAGHAHDNKMSTIAVVAHYDSFGAAPELSFGADSNGSGVVMLMELARLFSLLYSDIKSHGKYNIIFLLTGGGKMNYQGSKKWLEDQLDSLDGSLIQDASYIMCLDTVATGDSLYMHVSKPPKDGSAAALYFKELKLIANRHSIVTLEGVHKKINLAEDLLAWEHERFSIRRLPAFTLSSLKSHKDLLRGSIVDTLDNFDFDRLVKNTQLVAEALANQIFNVSGAEVFGGSVKVDRSYLEAWIKLLSTQPRSAQLLCNKDNTLVTFLKDTLARYLRDVRISYTAPEKRDPDFMFYDVTEATVNIYNVKPAVFDLILTVMIVLYLGSVYLIIQNFSRIYKITCHATSGKPKIY